MYASGHDFPFADPIGWNNLSSVRVSLPLSASLCLLVVLATGLLGMRGRDFLREPTPGELAVVRAKALLATASSTIPDKAAIPAPAGQPSTPQQARPLPVVLHIGTEASAAEIIQPALKKTVSEIEQASHGVIEITTKLSCGDNNPNRSGPAPVALWFSGPGEQSPTTDTLAFCAADPITAEAELLATAYQVLKTFFARAPELSLPDRNETPALDAIHQSVTREAWLMLGKHLNRTP